MKNLMLVLMLTGIATPSFARIIESTGYDTENNYSYEYVGDYVCVFQDGPEGSLQRKATVTKSEVINFDKDNNVVQTIDVHDSSRLKFGMQGGGRFFRIKSVVGGANVYTNCFKSE